MADQPQHDCLATALAAAQSEFSPIGKGKHSPAFGGYNYADLATVLASLRPALSRQGIAVLQRFDTGEQGDTALVTELRWRDERVASRVPLKLAGIDPQKAGIQVSYWRRYSLLALCGAAPEDEDSDGVEPTSERPRQVERRPEPPRQSAAPTQHPAARQTAPRIETPTPAANGRGWSVTLPGENPIGPFESVDEACRVLWRAIKGEPGADGMNPAEIQAAIDGNRAMIDAAGAKARDSIYQLRDQVLTRSAAA
jgi:hypothetical protein